MAAIKTAPPAYFSSIPAYSFADTHLQSAPAYANTPDASERTLQSTSHGLAQPSNASANLGLRPPVAPAPADFVYMTDHMVVNLGSRVWDLRMPAYGRLGHVEGSLKFLGEQAHITCVGLRVSVYVVDLYPARRKANDAF